MSDEIKAGDRFKVHTGIVHVVSLAGEEAQCLYVGYRGGVNGDESRAKGPVNFTIGALRRFERVNVPPEEWYGQ